jgi:hypothetical protein
VDHGFGTVDALFVVADEAAMTSKPTAVSDADRQ